MNFEIRWLFDMAKHQKDFKPIVMAVEICLAPIMLSTACKNGGLVYQSHNELQDENCDLMKKAGFNQVICEPIVKEAGDNGLGELRGDWSVRGFLIRQKVAVFDTRIFNAKPSSYKSLSL